MTWIQWVIDWLHAARRAVSTSITFLSMRSFGVEATFKEVSHGEYSREHDGDLQLELAQDMDTLLSAAQENFEVAQDRRHHISDKCKTLLTLTSLFVAIVGLLLPKALDFDSIVMRLVSCVAVLCAINAVFLLLVFFGIGSDARPTIVQNEVALSRVDLQKSLFNTLRHCQTQADRRTDFLVDLYKTARMFYLMALSLMAMLFCVSYLEGGRSDLTQRIVAELRANPDLIKLLRGPEGRDGRDGTNGTKGDKGDAGSKGDTPQIDMSQVIRELLSNDQFKRLIEAELARFAAEKKPAAKSAP